MCISDNFLYFLLIYCNISVYLGFPVGSDGKNLPAMQETWIWSLGWEDSLEEGTVTYSNIFAWKIPRTEEPGGLQSIGSEKVWHNWNDWACTRAHTHAYSGFHHSALTKKLLLNSTKDLYVDNAHKHLSTCFTWSKLKLTFLSELPSFQSPHDDSCFILQMSLQLFM